MLRPGGTLAFCGEPSRYGDLLAAVPKRGAALVAPLWRRLVGRLGPASGPRRAKRRPRAGARGRRPRLRAATGWQRCSRTPASGTCGSGGGAARERLRLDRAHPRGVRRARGGPERWREFAFRGYIALQGVDTALLEPRLPASLFYNLVLSARRRPY